MRGAGGRIPLDHGFYVDGEKRDILRIKIERDSGLGTVCFAQIFLKNFYSSG